MNVSIILYLIIIILNLAKHINEIKPKYNMYEGMLGFGIFFIFAIVALLIFFFVFWIWMLIDCIGRKFKGDNEKLLWALVIILCGSIGAALYYFLVKNKIR